jgi:pilus assembly protein CpaE
VSDVLTIGAGPDLARRVGEVLDGDVADLAVTVLDTDGGLLARLKEAGSPLVVVLGAQVPVDRAFQLADAVDAAAPGTSVVVVAHADPDLWLAAMRAGVRELLSPTAGPDEVTAALQRAAAAARARREAVPVAPAVAASDHRVVVVASSKGGVGKTTVATNLAVGLARSGAGSTVLVDLVLQFGDVASALALAPEYTLPDTVRGAASSDPLVLKTFLARHSSGLLVVAGSESPAAGDTVSAEQVATLLDTLRQEFRYVVVDTATGLSDHTLAALERCTDVVLMTAKDVPGIRGLRKELDLLTELGLLPAARHLVLNAVDPGGSLSMADVETAVGSPLDVVLPRNAAVPESTNTGLPLLLGTGRDPVSRGLEALLARLLPVPESRRSGLFGRRRAAVR